jgi:hypothetical protein
MAMKCEITWTPTMMAFAPITDMMLKLRKVMEDMKKKPKKKEGKPNCDEDLCFENHKDSTRYLS